MGKSQIKKRLLSFTLAEILIILGIFSVIAAATLPIFTAHNRLGSTNYDISGNDASDKWIYGSNGAMSNVYSSDAGKTVVAIGMEPVSGDIADGAKPQLIINKPLDGSFSVRVEGYDDINITMSDLFNVGNTSHITFLGTSGTKVYYNGRMSLLGKNVVMGNDALFIPLRDGDIEQHNIAIGSKSANRESMVSGVTINSGGMKLHDTVALGYKSLFGGSGPYNVAVGSFAGYKQYGEANVMLGNKAGYNSVFADEKKMYGIHIGNHAGFDQHNLSATEGYPINIGYYTAEDQHVLYPNEIKYPINIGYYAAANGSLVDVASASYTRPINIGTFAGHAFSYNNNAGQVDTINIGYSAGYRHNYKTEHDMEFTVNIGSYAGVGGDDAATGVAQDTSSVPFRAINIGNFAGHLQMGKTGVNYPINIGTYAGYKQITKALNINYAINIGAYAGANQSYNSGAGYPINIGNYAGYNYINNTGSTGAPINIGNYAGANRTESGTRGYTICIGTNACRGGYANYDIRIGARGNSIGLSSTIIGLAYGGMSTKDLIERRSYLGSGYPHKDVYVKEAGPSITNYSGYGNCSDSGTTKTCVKQRVTYTYSNKAWSPISPVYSAVYTYEKRCVFYSNSFSNYVGAYANSWKNYNCCGYYISTSGLCSPRFELTNGSGTGYAISVTNPTPQENTSYSKYSQLLIAPGNTAGNALTDTEYNSSSILLYSNHIYGPTTTMNVYSDKRLKENIRPSKYSLKDLRKINIYEYNYKNDKNRTKRIGVIAQELQKIIPQAVVENRGFLNINSSWINYTVLNSVKELVNIVDEMKAEFVSYVKEFVALVTRVNDLEKEISNLEQENKKLLITVDKMYKKAKAIK